MEETNKPIEILSPKAGILVQTRRRPHEDTCQKETQQEIINTLVKCKSTGLEEISLFSISHSLHQINKEANLFKPEEVKAYISTMQNIKTKKPKT